jgi:CelD/BcsL family acetyltransferase involved in cellulose biosynthesis
MPRYTTRVLTSESDLESVRTEWARRVLELPRPHIEQHPDWLAIEGRATGQEGTRMVVTLHDDGRLVGVAPFLMRSFRWPCRLGYTSVAKFPMRLADLAGESLVAPDSPEAHEAMARALADASVPYQMIYLESTPVGSSLWRWLESPAIAERFWLHRPGEVTPHRLIELPDTFQAYLASFNGKSRRNIQNAIRKLEKSIDGALSLDRVTARSDVASFLERVERVQSRTWQARSLGMEIRASAAQRERLGGYADRGWLRSYLLRAGETPLAFVIGFQADGTYYYNTVGYDLAFVDQRPGTALLYRLIEDLCATNRPRWLDFGQGDSEYKRIFSNVEYDEASVYLLRKSAYTGVARASHRACEVVSRATRTGLDRLGLRERVRHILRGRSSRPTPGAVTSA